MSKYRYEVRLTQFHGGGDYWSIYEASDYVVSRHKSLQAAELKVCKLRRSTDCVCGCYVIVDSQER